MGEPGSGGFKSALRAQAIRSGYMPMHQDQPEPIFAHRGITGAEHDSIARSGHIQSNMRYSHESEGTNFADNPGDAESYVNFGRDDPTKTGKHTYVLKVNRKAAGERGRDGYLKTKAPVPEKEIVGVRRFNPDGSVTEGRWQSGKGFVAGDKKG